MTFINRSSNLIFSVFYIKGLSSRPRQRQHISKFFKEVEELDEAQDSLDFDKKDFVQKNFR